MFPYIDSFYTDMEKHQSISCSTNNNIFHQQQRKLQQATTTKNKMKFKKKTKPIKVVYISNPMKVNTSVSEFRTLVQKLTGRDSELGTEDDVDDDNNDFFSMGKYHSRFRNPSAIVPDLAPLHHHMMQEVPAVVLVSATTKKEDENVTLGKAGGQVQEVPGVASEQLLNDSYRCTSVPSPPTPPAAALMNDALEYEQEFLCFPEDGYVPQMMIDNNFNGFLPSSITSTSFDMFTSLHELVAPAPAL